MQAKSALTETLKSSDSQPLVTHISFLQLGPLRHKTFRWLWLAGLTSFLGTWIHNVAARWTAATLSFSPLSVTTVDTLQVLPVVFLSLGAGKLADSVDRRRLLLTTHAILAAITALMGLFAINRRLSLPILFALTAFIGGFNALNGPAWQATVPRQVPEEEVPGAVALISTAFNVARTIGPAVGAWVLLYFGSATAFFANSASYIFIGLLIWQLPPQPPRPVEGGLASALVDPTLRRLYFVILVFGLLAMPALALLPVIARDALVGGATSYGALLSAFGIGAACTGPFVAAAARRLGYRTFVALACAAGTAGLVTLSLGHALPIAMLGAALCGSGWIVAVSTTNAKVNTHAPAAVRARALAFYITFAFSGQAGGSFIGGWMALHVGLALALQIYAVLMALLAVGVLNLKIDED
jgi:MFS family permease